MVVLVLVLYYVLYYVFISLNYSLNYLYNYFYITIYNYSLLCTTIYYVCLFPINVSKCESQRF